MVIIKKPLPRDNAFSIFIFKKCILTSLRFDKGEDKRGSPLRYICCELGNRIWLAPAEPSLNVPRWEGSCAMSGTVA